MTAQEHLEKRNALIAEARTILDGAEVAGRAMNSEEADRYNRIFSDAQGHGERMQVALNLEAEERKLSTGELRAGTQEGNTDEEDQAKLELRAGDLYGTVAGRILPVMQPEYRSAFVDRYLLTGATRGMYLAEEHQGGTELRNLQMDDSAKGGFAVAPEDFTANLIKFVDDLVFVRQWANVVPTAGAHSLGRPTLDTDPADADWTTELATGGEDSSMALGKRELVPHPLAKRVKVSRKLLRNAALPIDQLVRERLGYKFAVSQEKAFLLGTGAQQPLGVMVPTADGISTGRDQDTGATTTFTFDGLIAGKYKLKMQYWPAARWLIHRDGQSKIAQLKASGSGEYLWRESVRVGEPDRMLGFPIFMSEFMPATYTAAEYVAILGDWNRGYMIADSMLLDLQVLSELYAESNEIGYIGRAELDGMPVLEEAFVRFITDAS